jgi:alkaline phosphatase D
LAKTPSLARWHWQRSYSRATLVDFHRHVGSYFMKDDHDTWKNDCWPSMEGRGMFQFTFKQGLKIFPQQVPMGKSTYRTRRWGKDLQIWMVEGRDFRSPNNAPDGPTKTIWGAEQMAWFKKSVAASDAAFRVLISPTPWSVPTATTSATIIPTKFSPTKATNCARSSPNKNIWLSFAATVIGSI